MNYIASILRGTRKIERISFLTLYFIISIFYLTASHIVFSSNAVMMSNAVLIYLGITAFALVLSQKYNYHMKLQNIIDTLPLSITYMLVIYFIYAVMFSIVNIPSSSIASVFSNSLFAIIYAIFIVGYPETIIFNEILPYRIGAIPSSVIFAIVHYGTLTVTMGQSLFTLTMLYKMFAIFIANLIFIYIFRTTRSRFITAYAHGLYDLFVWGVL